MLNSRPLSYIYSDASEVRLGETHFYSAKDYTFPISDGQRKLGGSLVEDEVWVEILNQLMEPLAVTT